MTTNTIEGPRPSDQQHTFNAVMKDMREYLEAITAMVDPFDGKLDALKTRDGQVFQAGRNGESIDAAEVMVMLQQHREDLLLAGKVFAGWTRLASTFLLSLENFDKCHENLMESMEANRMFESQSHRMLSMLHDAVTQLEARQQEDDDIDDDDIDDAGEDDAERWMN